MSNATYNIIITKAQSSMYLPIRRNKVAKITYDVLVGTEINEIKKHQYKKFTVTIVKKFDGI